MATPVDEHYVKARTGLLDALDALGPLRRAVILVGAQAVYVHTESVDADFAVSPFTYDADIALDPEMLDSKPKITEAMEAAGFNLADQPGIYRKPDGSQVDLLVPEAVGGAGRRGARLGVHGDKAARKVYGLEGALVSHKPIVIRSLTPADPRSYTIEVAGPGALLVAKICKIAERIEDHSSSRSQRLDKDAFDIYRLLRVIDASELAAEIQCLLENKISKLVTETMVDRFSDLFGSTTAIGTQLVGQHLAGTEDSDFIAASSATLSLDLLEAIGTGSQ